MISRQDHADAVGAAHAAIAAIIAADGQPDKQKLIEAGFTQLFTADDVAEQLPARVGMLAYFAALGITMAASSAGVSPLETLALVRAVVDQNHQAQS